MTATLTQPVAPSIDFDAIKKRQQATWADGDFTVIGATTHVTSELLVEAVNPRSIDRVLDVATGSGNGAIAAARRWCDATGVDYVPALLDRARERAAAERMNIRFVEGDAEALPFQDGEFDVVLSVYGVMFAPNQPRAAAELMRVTRPGGTIGLASWTPAGFIGQLFKAIARHVAPPAGLSSPMLWGTEDRVRELLADRLESIQATRRDFMFCYDSPEHFIHTFRTYYGPTLRAFGALDAAGQEALAVDLKALLSGMNVAGDAALVVPSEYLEVVARLR
jgi:SAM-dependent methyltransferase